jgi:hypothetical protein
MAQGGYRPGAGRKPGSMNKKTADVIEKLAQLKFDPIEAMARIAMNKKATLELRGRMAAELAQYIAPKRRATEHSGAINLVEEAILNLQE